MAPQPFSPASVGIAGAPIARSDIDTGRKRAIILHESVKVGKEMFAHYALEEIVEGKRYVLLVGLEHKSVLPRWGERPLRGNYDEAHKTLEYLYGLACQVAQDRGFDTPISSSVAA